MNLVAKEGESGRTKNSREMEVEYVRKSPTQVPVGNLGFVQEVQTEESMESYVSHVRDVESTSSHFRSCWMMLI